MSDGCVFPNARRCTATSKRTHKRCKAPAVRGRNVCRFHGAGGGAPTGKRHGNYRHGLHTNKAIAERRFVRELLRQARETVNAIPCGAEVKME